LQADIVDISTGEEQAHQENPTLEAPENPTTTVDTLVNLQDPILETPENLATTVDTLVNLQDLQELIATSSAIILLKKRYVISLSRLHFSFPVPY
jgi:hypothetical protein